MNFNISVDFIESQSLIELLKDRYILKVKIVSNKKLSESLLELLVEEIDFKNCLKDKLEFCVKNNIDKIEEMNIKLKDFTEYSCEEPNSSEFYVSDQIRIIFVEKEIYIRYNVFFKKTIEQLLQEIKNSTVYF